MNSPLVRWLLDVDSIPRDAENLRMSWEHPFPAWVWTLIVIGVTAFAFWSYARLAGKRPARGFLAAARTAIILLALIVISGPMLELPRVTVEPDWVMVLADRSRSMQIADVPPRGNGAGVQRMTREQQLADIIDDNAPLWNTLASNRELRWLGFHSSAFQLANRESGSGNRQSTSPRPPVDVSSLPRTNDSGSSVPALGEPSGERTNLNAAIEQALQRAAARPVSGLVVMSDGRTIEAPSRALLRRLQAEAIPVFVVPLGSAEPMGDLALRRVDMPRRAFVRDKVPVVVEVERFGDAAMNRAATVRLVDELTGETLDEVDLPPGIGEDGESAGRLTLTAEPDLAGEANWVVVLDTDEPDLIPENNRKSMTIELVDRPLRVLYIDGYPRWEYRYVKNLLVRESSVESSVMLLSADRDFAQEGNDPITRLPRSPEEFARYDVMILGDAPASFFSPEQLDLMRDHVSERGAGLLWIGGSRHTPRSYSGTVLADLLPMRGSLNLSTISAPVNMIPTELARRLGVLQLVTGAGVGWPHELADPLYRWSQLYAAQRIEPGQLKPTAEVLAETVQPIDGQRYPLVTHMRYGAGEIIYVATDEIWRWRHGRGEMLPEQFWIQMVRMLGRESLAASGHGAVLEVSPRRVPVGQPVRLQLRLLDSQLIAPGRSSVRAVIETEDGESISALDLPQQAEAEDRFAATYLPERTGQLRVRIDDRDLTSALAPSERLVAPLEVFAPDDELRRPETDHALLAQLAEATGGRVLQPDEVRQLIEPQVLRNRAVRTENPLRERIWDTPLAFILVLMLLTFEWIGRKVIRLM